MNIKKIIVLFFITSIGLNHLLATQSRQALEAKIKMLAEDQQRGYKCANLHELDELAKDFNEENHAYKTAVPTFVEITSAILWTLFNFT